MAKPIPLERIGRRFQCTFLPWTVRPHFRGPTTQEHWEQFSPEVFRELEPASLALMNEVMALAPDRASSILDMGCNVGRHLDYLYRHGYRNLRGVDWSSRAIEEMARRYPAMHAASTLSSQSFQDYLAQDREQVDLLYTRGATFELVHPSFPLIRQVCRIARRYAVLVISEFGHAYPRFWEYEFAREGFELAHARRPAAPEDPGHRVSLLAFRRLGA